MSLKQDYKDALINISWIILFTALSFGSYYSTEPVKTKPKQEIHKTPKPGIDVKSDWFQYV